MIIAELWESYRRQVIPPTAPEIQIVECRRAFYAGAKALFDSVINLLDPGAEPTQRELDLMSQIVAELDTFKDDVVSGKM